MNTKWIVESLIGLIWRRIGAGGDFLWKFELDLPFCKIVGGIYWPTEQLLTSREAASSRKWLWRSPTLKARNNEHWSVLCNATLCCWLFLFICHWRFARKNRAGNIWNTEDTCSAPLLLFPLKIWEQHCLVTSGAFIYPTATFCFDYILRDVIEMSTFEYRRMKSLLLLSCTLITFY
jgi:hypothetical protein